MNQRVLQINSGIFGSTGTIMRGIAAVSRDQGIEAYVAYPDSRSNTARRITGDLVIGSRVSRNLHIQLGFATGMQGTYSRHSTLAFLREVRRLRPDVIHLHNLHDCYVNLPMLFDFIRSAGAPVVWTLHDCWALTGKCTHYTAIGCEKWSGACHDCPQLREYPAALIDRTQKMHSLKKLWFSDVENMVLVTPSKWLRSQVKRSHLGDYEVRVINNGIDLEVFKPTSGDFRRRYGLGAKKIVLGVAHGWSRRKGLPSFLDLRERLSSRYVIVIVGLSSDEIREMPTGVVGIGRTEDAYELAGIYTAADVFFNPTLEDNYPTVNLEALACGTPVVTFRTGGAAEILNENCGMAVETGDMASAVRGIQAFAEGENTAACVLRVAEHSKEVKFREYIALYDELAARRAEARSAGNPWGDGDPSK